MPQLTIRARLTLVYGGLFLLAGVLLLGVTYAMVSQQLPSEEELAARNADLQNLPSPPSGKGLIGKVAGDTWESALDALLTQGGIALLLVGAVAVGLVWVVAGRMLQPLHQITGTARRIASAPAADRGLHERIKMDGPYDEIRELAETFDLMLERLDGAFDGQRRFIANASHELRTPLALNRALLEVALHRRAVAVETRQLGETLLEINNRHERLIDGLLLLARSERELTERSFVDLADIVDHVAAQQPEGPVAVHTAARPAPTLGNSVLLERLVQNLVENAVRYNVAGDGWVRVSTDTGPDDSVVLRVSNTGPAVAPYDMPALFEPFRRGAEDRLATKPGAGLGLSIVRAVARAHGGDVSAEPRDGGGLEVTVTLPAAPGADDADPDG
ncbi:MAG: sensor histidine kinase [Micromonosporaceae bacterium]